jgi:hypothetical protein
VSDARLPDAGDDDVRSPDGASSLDYSPPPINLGRPVPAWTPHWRWLKTPGCTFYDAELLRLRARCPQWRRVRRARTCPKQGATLFELHAALDDFELRGVQARVALLEVVERRRADGAWP